MLFFKSSPLLTALGKQHLEFVALLLVQPNIDLFLKNRDGLASLHLMVKYGNTDLLKKALQLIQTSKAMQTRFAVQLRGMCEIASNKGHAEIVALLSDFAGAKFGQAMVQINEISRGDDSRGDESGSASSNSSAGGSQVAQKNSKDVCELFSAVRNKKYRYVEHLLTSGSVDINVFEKGRALIHAAAARGDLKMVRLLLRRGADPYIVTQQSNHVRITFGENFLHVAVRSKRRVVLAVLLDNTVDANKLLTMKNAEGETVIGMVKNRGYSSLLQQFLESFVLEKNRATCANKVTHGESDLERYVREADEEKILGYLNKQKDHVDDLGPSGKTALCLAVELGLPHMVKLLLDEGANPFFKLPSTGQSLYQSATWGGNITVARLFKKYVRQRVFGLPSAPVIIKEKAGKRKQVSSSSAAASRSGIFVGASSKVKSSSNNGANKRSRSKVSKFSMN